MCSLFSFTDEDGSSKLCSVCADDDKGTVSVFLGQIQRGGYESLTARFEQTHLFERELWEQSGLVPQGHPWLKPVRFPQHGTSPQAVGSCDFFSMEGEEIHEVAVGPVHAGIIEPGHFRFQCHGETVFHLEISLGYQHRGIERALPGGPYPKTLCQLEAAAGDSTVGHAMAYCQTIESLGSIAVPFRAHAVRAVALELERCANHTGDLGALAGDIGYLPTQSYCGRIRGEFLNLTAMLCGNRFGRGLVIPGGVSFDIEESRAGQILDRLEKIRGDFLSATRLIWKEPSVMARFEQTGTVSRQLCERLGVVGPAARASGCNRDVRQDHAFGFFRTAHVPVITSDKGDVEARAYVRWREAQESMQFIAEQVKKLPMGKVSASHERLAARKLVVSLTEAWRGEVCHTAITDSGGRLLAYKIVDPSFHNWIALAMAMRGQQISDFPLCNKSFNLSYCGFDL